MRSCPARPEHCFPPPGSPSWASQWCWPRNSKSVLTFSSAEAITEPPSPPLPPSGPPLGVRLPPPEGDRPRAARAGLDRNYRLIDEHCGERVGGGRERGGAQHSA